MCYIMSTDLWMEALPELTTQYGAKLLDNFLHLISTARPGAERGFAGVPGKKYATYFALVIYTFIEAREEEEALSLSDMNKYIIHIHVNT